MIGTVTINPSIDQHILIDRLTKDDAIRAREIRRDPGGKGINVSRVVKELGGETVAFGVSGGCAGYMLKNLMAEHSIPCEAIEVPEETRINVILTDRSDWTQTRISAPGPRITLAELEQFTAKIVSCEPFPAWWVLGGSLPPGVPDDFYARVISSLQQRGAKCLLDADDEALKLGLQANPYLIKPNEHEFARLIGRPLPTEQSLIDAAQEVIAGGVQVVAITLGRKGALIVSQGKALHVASPDVEVRSKVGAGDSFLAGVVLALSHGQSLESAVRLGTAAGTAAVMHEGTQLCRREDVERLVDQITITPLKTAASSQVLAETTSVRDVVCGMDVDPALSGFSATDRGTVYQFCSLKCQQQFEAAPQRFVRNVTA
ncbi:MAG: 1-phosphofructokinase [Candidatus Omnitrophica bacterium]|nr:1-phosphofructokinase [Candidatus Omnitrophota bacterium]